MQQHRWLPRTLVLLLAASASNSASDFGDGSDPEMVQIEFDPMGGDGSSPMVMMADGPGGGSSPMVMMADGPGGAGMPPPEALMKLLGGGRQRRPSQHKKEDELDRNIEATLGSLLGPPAMSRGREETQTILEGPGGTEMIISGDSGPPGAFGPFGPMQRGAASKSSMKVGEFRDLFPGPLVIEQQGGPGGASGGTGPAAMFDGPDPVVMDMMQDIGQAFQQDLLPSIHKAGGGSQAPRSCEQDLRKHCSTARSQVHCLGQHQDDITSACRKDVGKSVPFLCSKQIDRWCDILQNGILNCLGDHLNELSDAEVACKDAVVATRQVIAKASTQKASVVDSRTGEKKATVANQNPSVIASPVQREASLDAQLGIAKVRSASTEAPARDLREGRAQGPAASAETLAKEMLGREASFLATAAAEARPPLPKPVARSWHPWNVMFGLVLVATILYFFVFTDIFKSSMSTYHPYYHGDGARPLKTMRNNVEMPRPVDL